MPVFTKRLRKLLVERKDTLQTTILCGTGTWDRYNLLLGAYNELLRTERDIEEILSELSLEEEEED